MLSSKWERCPNYPPPRGSVPAAARQREQTEEFKQEYARRAGVEGIHAQGVRTMGLRRSRYIGEPRTHLQHVVTATAMNVCRLYDWLEGTAPHPTPVLAT